MSEILTYGLIPPDSDNLPKRKYFRFVDADYFLASSTMLPSYNAPCMHKDIRPNAK